MIQVPGAIVARFEACLAAKNISENLRLHYKKWLRFYLDFCSKYRRDANKTESLADSQQKLLEKGQTVSQQKQAAHAISLYLGIGQASASDRPSVSSPASVFPKGEVSEIKIPLQYAAMGDTPLRYSWASNMRARFKPYTIDTGLRNRVAFSFSQDLEWLVENVVFCYL